MTTKTTLNTSNMFASLLAVLLIGLKLTGYIAWPWLWVLSPIWIPAAMVLLAVILKPAAMVLLAVILKVGFK